MEAVFQALSDPNRRLLLDRLFEGDGQSLGELCAYLPGMTRFGVMNHLAVLEAAQLITVLKVGRQKHHFLNPVPIRLVHDRWIGKFAAPIVGRMVAIKEQLEGTSVTQRHVYVSYIRADASAIWAAITDGARTEQYFYGTRAESEWQVGAPVRYLNGDGSVAADGTVLAIEPGTSVTVAFHARWDPALVEEGPVRMTWRIEPAGVGVCKLSVIHEEMGPRTTEQFVPGIAFIVAGLKSLLETGTALPQQGAA